MIRFCRVFVFQMETCVRSFMFVDWLSLLMWTGLSWNPIVYTCLIGLHPFLRHNTIYVVHSGTNQTIDIDPENDEKMTTCIYSSLALLSCHNFHFATLECIPIKKNTSFNFSCLNSSQNNSIKCVQRI